MVAVDAATAAKPLRRPVTKKDEAKRGLAYLLARSLADEGIPDDLIATLEKSSTTDPASPFLHGRSRTS